MRKIFLLSAALLLPIAAIYAQDAPGTRHAIAGSGLTPPAAQGEHGFRGPDTLDEARKRAHERTEWLDKMTPEKWDEMKKRQAAGHAEWAKLTPAERDAKKAEWDKRRAEWANMTPAQRDAAKAERREHNMRVVKGAPAPMEVPGAHE